MNPLVLQFPLEQGHQRQRAAHDRVIDPQNAKVHRHDAATGLRVFKAHALGLGQGGGTPLCPFDCKCCY